MPLISSQIFKVIHFFLCDLLNYLPSLITLTGAVLMILWKLDLQLHITTNIVSSNPAQAKCNRYNIHVIKYVSDLRAGWWFSPSTTDSPPIKLTATI